MRTKKEKVFAYVVVGLYLLFLCWLILFKLADSVDKIPSMRGINLIPFYYDRLSNTSFHLTEVLYNVLVFVPAGFFFTAFGKGKPAKGIIACAALSLGFEILQFVFALGASDITDLMTNTAGGTLGAIMFSVMGKLFKGRQLTIVCFAGAVIEALFIILLIVLIMGSRGESL